MDGAADISRRAKRGEAIAFDPRALEPRLPVALCASASGTRAVAMPGVVLPPLGAAERLVAVLPPTYPEWLGDGNFARRHGARFPYVVGEMARGIATAEMVIAAAEAGLLAFFGSAGLALDESERAMRTIATRLGPARTNWGANLIHSPDDPQAELAFARTAIELGLKRVSASAFMRLSPAIVWLSCQGLVRAPDGRVVRARQVIGKVSRAEVARPFLSPAPPAILSQLSSQGLLTPLEVELARQIPVSEDLTVEADSGGHTDNRPLTVLLPEILGLARELERVHDYPSPLCIGAGGGIGTPAAASAAFALGAGYVVTGSINQCTIESGLSADARRMLAEAEPSDVAMAPAADMFELGVKVQVLKRGTFFAQRASRLYETYRRHDGIAALTVAERTDLERNVLGRSIDQIWGETRAHFSSRAPAELERAERDPKHQLALVFRWYLFMAAHWARVGDRARRADYQVWCGPAMGAFNRWVKGSFLEPPESRGVVQIALNLLEGAAHVARAQALRQAGLTVPASAFEFRPRALA